MSRQLISVDAAAVPGTLTANDRSKPYRFATTPGRTYVITVTASGFDPALTVGGVAKPQAGSLAETETHTLEAGPTQIEATVDVAGRNNATGSFTIAVTKQASVATSFVRVIDDGDAAYSDDGFTVFTKAEGIKFQGDARFSKGKSRTATWNFGTPPVGRYRISAT